MTSKDIYTSEKALPYVYRITNKKTKEFYIGYRYKNVDLGLTAIELVGPNKGKGHQHKSKRTKEHTEKLREARIGIPLQKTTCPYCNFTGGGGNMKRYHFNNCKQLLSKN